MLNEFISSAQIKYLTGDSKATPGCTSLKELLHEIFTLANQERDLDLGNIKSFIHARGDIIACSNQGSQKYKVKILPRGQQSSEIIIALEDLSQFEEIRMMKQKVKEEDRNLSAFFENFRNQVQNIYVQLDASTSQIVDDPQKHLQQAKRYIEKLFNTVQNFVEYRVSSKQKENRNQSANSSILSTLQGTLKQQSLQNFNFVSLMDEMHILFPQIICEPLGKLISVENDLLAFIYSDLPKIRSLFLTLFFAIEDSLPEQLIKLVRCRYEMKEEDRFQSFQVLLCIPQYEISSQSPITPVSSNQPQTDAFFLLKNLLKADYNQIRAIELENVISTILQLGPFEMHVQEELTELKTEPFVEKDTNRNDISITDIESNQESSRQIRYSISDNVTQHVSNNKSLNIKRPSLFVPQSNIYSKDTDKSSKSEDSQLSSQTPSQLNCHTNRKLINDNSRITSNQKQLSFSPKNLESLSSDNFTQTKRLKGENITYIKKYVFTFSFFKDIRVLSEEKNNNNIQNRTKNKTQNSFLQPNNNNNYYKKVAPRHSKDILTGLIPNKSAQTQINISPMGRFSFVSVQPLSAPQSISKQSQKNNQLNEQHQISIPQFQNKTLANLNQI